jgi:F-type H+-transporting ATPase subunit b
MSIDWFTFTAQLLNFVLLVWLLKRFLYRPILSAIAAREKRISAELANAAAIESEARQERARFEHNNSDFELQRDALLDQARDEAKTEYQRLVAEARDVIDALTHKRLAALETSVANQSDAIRRRVQQEVFAISRKILTELAAEDLEQRMTDTLLKRLRALNVEARQKLHNVIEADDRHVLLRSAFALSQPQIDAIKSMLDDIAGSAIELRSETVPQLISGIEVIANGHKLAWSVADYLASLEQSVAALAAAHSVPGHRARARNEHEQSTL